MVPSIRVDGCTASFSRADDWNACCARVMGYEEWALESTTANSNNYDNNNNDQASKTPKLLQVTNLLPAEFFGDDDDIDDDEDGSNINNQHPVDPWTENALNLQADLERMANWIQSKKWSFTSFDGMRDGEASLIQSTVTSFAATTANDIESLRKMASKVVMSNTTDHNSSSSNSNNAIQHRNGIVQILFARLKEDIVEPFGVLQKHRSRKAVGLWQNPLQCKLLVKAPPTKRKQRDELDEALGLDDDDDDNNNNHNNGQHGALKKNQRFLPSRDSHKPRIDFMETYQRDEHVVTKRMKRPTSLILNPFAVLSSENECAFDPHKKNRDGSASNSNSNSNNQATTSYNQQHRPNNNVMQSVNYGGNNNNNGMSMMDYEVTQEQSEAAHQQMQQEALVLQTMVNSDLDSVQKMEQQMVSITTLLTQFSELVLEQQEEVWQIHDTAKETKDNMDKGQDALVNAAEQTYSSNHYMAKGIFGMAWLLLLFHWLRP